MGDMLRESTASHLRHIVTGSWNAYTMEGFNSTNLTSTKIKRSMEVFSRKYKYEVEMHPYFDLMLWELTLEEKEGRKERAKSRRSGDQDTLISTTAPITKPPTIKKYKLGVCDEEKLFFSSKILPISMKKMLQVALGCHELALAPMSNADPLSLLLFHRQAAHQNSGILGLQRDKELEILSDKMAERLPSAEEKVVTLVRPERIDKVQEKLGVENIPLMKKLCLTVDNVPCKSEVPALAGFRITELEAEVHTPSVFHLYKELAESGIIENIPPWLEKARKSGRDTVTARYN